ncbi:MAG: protein kinase domain-containing protein [Acidimicrobiales bacterium]
MTEGTSTGYYQVARVLAGRYRLVGFIARGGMAEVWEGHDELLARSVAVKLPLAHLAGQPGFMERFRREAVAAARLSHPNVVAVYDTGTDGDDSFIVMERVHGCSLRQILDDRQGLGVAASVAIAAQVASALDFAHRHGVVHRDVKPANILITGDNTVKVADFGIAKAVMSQDMTQTSVTLGTARYISPEQAEGHPPDGRSDLYSLAVVLYEMMCGQAPFEADNEVALAIKHIRAAVIPMRQRCPEAPAWLDEVVDRALAKDPNDRFATAGEFGAVLLAGAESAGILAPTTLVLDPARPGSTDVSWEAMGHRAAVGADVTTVVGGGVAAGTLAQVAGRVASDPDLSRSAGNGDADRRGRAPARRWVPSVVGALAALAVATVAILAFTLLVPGKNVSSPEPSSPPVSIAPLAISSAVPFDPSPHADLSRERQAIANIFDSSPTTVWSTQTYDTRDFGRLVPGLGVVLNLSASHKLSGLTVKSPTPGYNASVYVAPSPQTDLAAWGIPVDGVTNAAGTATFNLHGATGSAVLIWFTLLSPTNQIQVANVQVTGQ